MASVTSFNVEENDFILIATDGVWDNLPDSTIVEEIKKIKVNLFLHKNFDIGNTQCKHEIIRIKNPNYRYII